MGLRRQIRDMMSGDASRPAWLAFLLSIAASLFGFAMRVRALLYEKGLLRVEKLPAHTIAVGNLTVGGTGKTPMVIHVARLIAGQGHRVAVISRGYGGTAMQKGGVVSDGERILLSPAEAGDEPVLMAMSLPGVVVVVGADRVRAGQVAVDRFGAEVLVADDAYQHMRLGRDVNLLLADAVRPFGNGRLVPRGVLREPVSAAKRADALVLTRSGGGGTPPPECAGLPWFRCSHRPAGWTALSGTEAGLTPGMDMGYPPAFLAGRSVFAFSGIANNQAFFDTVRELGCQVAGVSGSAATEAYTKKELAALTAEAKSVGAQCMATTAKDMVRLAGLHIERIEAFALCIDLEMEDAGAFDRFVLDGLTGTARG